MVILTGWPGVVPNYNPKCLHFSTFPAYLYSLYLFLPQLTGVFWMARNLGETLFILAKWHLSKRTELDMSSSDPKKNDQKHARKKHTTKMPFKIQTIHWGISILTSSTMRIVHRFPNLPPALEVAALMLSVLVGAERRLEKVRPVESRQWEPSRHLGERTVVRNQGYKWMFPKIGCPKMDGL